jgi:hypothetical protein
MRWMRLVSTAVVLLAVGCSLPDYASMAHRRWWACPAVGAACAAAEEKPAVALPPLRCPSKR